MTHEPRYHESLQTSRFSEPSFVTRAVTSAPTMSSRVRRFLPPAAWQHPQAPAPHISFHSPLWAHYGKPWRSFSWGHPKNWWKRWGTWGLPATEYALVAGWGGMGTQVAFGFCLKDCHQLSDLVRATSFLSGPTG